MTVNTIESSADFDTNGATVNFPFFFKFLANDDLVVTYVDSLGTSTVLALGTHYTVSGAGSEEGGSITTTSILASGKLNVSRDMDAYQQTSLRNQGKFLAETHEDVFDRLTMLIQQGFSWMRRALVRPRGKNYYDAEGRLIKNLGDGEADQDAVNVRTMRSYVDRAIAGVVGGFGWFLQSGVGAIYRTFQDKMRESVTPDDFGAIGDLVADDSVAVQNAFNSGKKVKLKKLYRVTGTLYSGGQMIVGEGHQTGLMFEGLNGAHGIVFTPTEVQRTSGCKNMAIYTKGSNGGSAVKTPYDAAQYEPLRSAFVWRDLLICGYTKPAPGTNNAFETIESWECSIDQGDGWRMDFNGVYGYGNYRSDTDPSTQFASYMLRMNAASALLTARIGNFTCSNFRQAVDIGDRIFFQIYNYDIAHVYDGICQFNATVPYGEGKILPGNINAQHFGIYFQDIGTRQITGPIIRRHRYGWKGATHDWAGIRLVNCTYVWLTDCQIAPDESMGAFTGTHYGIQLVDCGGVTITDPTINPGLDRGILLNNCTMTITDGVKTFQNEATDIIVRAINNTRSSRIGSYVKVSTFSGTEYSDDGSILPGAIQQLQRNVIPEGLSPSYFFRRSSNAVDEKIWKWLQGSTSLALQLPNDTESTSANGMIFNRLGTTVTSVDIRTSKLKLGNGPSIEVWPGNPEGNVSASPGSISLNTTAGGPNYRKNTGSGNTGWVVS